MPFGPEHDFRTTSSKAAWARALQPLLPAGAFEPARSRRLWRCSSRSDCAIDMCDHQEGGVTLPAGAVAPHGVKRGARVPRRGTAAARVAGGRG